MSFWLDNIAADSSNADPVDLDGVFDVVIIGCGISGASTAYHLALNNPAGRYLLLERGQISSGATGCNGGFICPGTSERFSSSVERYGLEATQELYDYTVKCTAAVKEFVEQTKADCEIRFHGCVQLAINEDELQALQLSYEQLKSYGQSAEWWDATTCAERTHSNSYLGGLFKPQAGMLWAAKLVHALVNEARKLGVGICTNTPVAKVENTTDGIVVHTEDGRVIRTKKVVYCTNAWTRELLPELQAVITPVRNQVILI
jgi:glycine/D-amino acid oxidase-like deaminating enzyme